MATAKILNPDEWNDRAEQLALAHGLDRCAEYVRCEYAGEDAEGHGYGRRELYRVPSSSAAGDWHRVAHDEAEHTVECDCTAAQYGRPCSHVGAVRLEISRRGIALQIWRSATGWEEVRR